MADDKSPIRIERFQKAYMERLRDLPAEDKLALIREAHPAVLLALCFDPHPQVAIALINHGDFNQRHALLLAQFHHSESGLVYLSTRPGLASDRGVQAVLFRNTTATKVAIGNCLVYLPLAELYRLIGSTDIGEIAKGCARERFRIKFQESSSGEKANLIVSSEGYCLSQLIGIRLDKDTAKILGGQEEYSLILARNLLNFPGIPGEVIRGLRRCRLIWQNKELRTRILAHTNCPADVRLKGN